MTSQVRTGIVGEVKPFTTEAHSVTASKDSNIIIHRVFLQDGEECRWWIHMDVSFAVTPIGTSNDERATGMSMAEIPTPASSQVHFIAFSAVVVVVVVVVR
jgi:hypothetical protein